MTRPLASTVLALLGLALGLAALLLPGEAARMPAHRLVAGLGALVGLAIALRGPAPEPAPRLRGPAFDPPSTAGS